MAIDVVTFGCRLNAYESEAIKARAGEAQLQNAVVVNTCAVTAEAVRQSRQAIRKLKRERPGTRIIVTGCAAQTEPQTYAAMPEVDAVLGNQEKLSAAAYADFGLGIAERVRVNDIMSVTRNRAPDGGSFRRPGARLPAGAEWLRPSLHLLHHPLWPGQFALGADGRGGGGSPPPDRKRLCRNRPDRRGPHLLWRAICRARRHWASWSPSC